MDIRQLKYFVAIAKAGSLSAAAQKLQTAQPSLSQHLVNMEQELDVRLVTRWSRVTTLTSEGEVLLRHAKRICAMLKSCLAEMGDLSSEVTGSVRFEMPPSVSMVLSVPLAETVRIELPRVRLHASEAMSGFIKTWIDDETVEIGFLYDLNDVEHLDAAHALDEQLYFFSAPDCWPLKTMPATPVPLRDIGNVDLVLLGEPHGLRRIIDLAAAQAGVALNIVSEIDAMTQIKELVARRSGYSIFSPAACHDFVPAGRLLITPIIDPVISRPVYLVRDPAFTQTRASAVIEKATRRVAADMVRRGTSEGKLVWTGEEN